MPLYFMPLVEAPDPREGRTRWLGKRWADLLPFGHAQMEMVGRHALIHSDCDAVTDAVVSADPDVIRLPDNLDAIIQPSEATALALHLAANDLPPSWVVAGTPWRRLVRRICAYYQFHQRHFAIHKEALFPKGTQVSRRMALAASQRQIGMLALSMQSMEELGGHGEDAKARFRTARAAFKLTSTVEEVMTSLADAWGNESMHLQDVHI